MTGKESYVCYASGVKPSTEARDIIFLPLTLNSQFTCTHKSEFSIQLTTTAYAVTEVHTKPM